VLQPAGRSAAQPAAHSAAHLADGNAPHPAAQPAAQSLAHAEANPVVHSAALAAVHPAPQPDLAPRFRGAAKSSARYRGPAVQYSTAAPVPSQHAGSALGDVAGASHLSKFYNVFNSGVWWVVFGAFDSMSLWVTAFLVIAIAAILLFLCMLIRFIQDGYEVHWMAGLPARTDWQHLSNGDFVKVVGHVVALPGREVVSPISRTPCVAYSISAGRCDSSKPGKKSVMQVKSFCVQDDQGRVMLIQGHEAVLYNLTTAKEWNYLTGAVPKEFHGFMPKIDHDAGGLALLRFREEVLEVGAKVCCVGAVSTLPNPHAAISLRPAYATLMFRDAQIPWSKLEGLSTSDWGKVASSVLVTSYRLGR
jgi:hypothetical protein